MFERDYSGRKHTRWRKEGKANLVQNVVINEFLFN
jgi:hypothetical protein